MKNPAQFSVEINRQDDATVAAALGDAEKGGSYARLFAFASGPAYGFLLDDYSKDWRKHLSAQSDLGDMLAHSADILLPAKNIAAAARQAGRRYNLAEVEADEKAIARAHDKQANIWITQLVKGAVLHLPSHHMKAEFNPSLLFPLPPYGTIYPRLQIVTDWGKLKVNGAALIDDDWTGVTVAAPTNATTLSGSGWTLELAPEWSIVPDKKPGDFTVAKKLNHP